MTLKTAKEHFRIFFRSKLLKWILIVIGCVTVFNFIFPVPHVKQYSKTIYASDGTLLTAFLTSDDKWRLKTELNEVSSDLIKAIINKEDKWFFWHFGINPIAIIRSLATNVTRGEIISGASTITMQVVRILEPRKRTYFNKFVDILRAAQLELNYSKNEILSIYLSHLPLGGNIEGIKSASYIYFNQPPKTLSLSQAILLSIIPSDPNSFRLDRTNERIHLKRDYWIKRFLKKELFPTQDLNDALKEPVVPNRFSIPHIAPHFCNYLKNKIDTEKIESTLDLKIQQTTENILWNHINRIRSKGISNGAVIIVDNSKSDVIGYCGSADFSNDISSGQVNGIIAARSPGSTLKPALYALSFETGFLTPGTKLLDVPTEFGGYEPENFDQKYHGSVSCEQALVNSLNIPAVELLDRVGVKNFIKFLKTTGFIKIEMNKEKLGLSLILGGCSVTLDELTAFYSSFTNNGQFRKLTYYKGQTEENSQKIFSAETSYLIAEILSVKQRNDMIVDYDYSKLPRFAWKTGTSFGKRDGWAIGFNPNYTIGVWVGNFEGSGSPSLTGADAALPLLADLFNAIDYKSKIKWFKKPDDVYTRDVCAESGLLPTSDCNNLAKEIAIRDRSHSMICNIHESLFVNETATIQFCADCLPESGYKRKTYMLYHPGLVSWFGKNNIPYENPPRHNPSCSSRRSGDGPKIISPSENFEYYVEEKSRQEIVLMAASNQEVRYHFWYVNNKFIGKSKPGQKIFYVPDRNVLDIVCLDDLGGEKSIRVAVKKY